MKTCSRIFLRPLMLTCILLLAACIVTGTALAAEATCRVDVSTVGNGTVTIPGNPAYTPTGESLQMHITPDTGWYVQEATAGSAALELPEAGGTVSITPTKDTQIQVTFARYPLRLEPADGSACSYYLKLSQAVQAVSSDADRIVLLDDVVLNSNDYISNMYRLDINRGFVLELNGKVLSADNGLLRLMYSDTETKSTITIQNGTLVAGVQGTSQHLMTIHNHGGLVMRNVKAYCGAVYTDGKIQVNQTEVNKTDKGVGTVIMLCSDVDAQFTDCELVTYGNYYAINTSNTDTKLAKGNIFMSNTVVRTHSAKLPVGCGDKRPYTLNITDENCVFITELDTGIAASYVTIAHFDGFTQLEKTARDENGTTVYDYAYPQTDSVSVASTGAGQVTVNGGRYTQVQQGQTVTVTVTPAQGWYVKAAKDSQGAAVSVPEAGGEISYTHTAGANTITVEFAQYAALLETADGSVHTYYKTLSAAVKKVRADTDVITLLRDVDLNSKDYMGNTYRLAPDQGFILDLNGKVLTSDVSFMRFMYNDSEKVSTLTIRNGTVVAAVGGDTQHWLTLYNHGSVVLENVQAYCGALYVDGQIVPNQAELAKGENKKGVSAVFICSGDGSITLTNTLLCTYGPYSTISQYNTSDDLEQTQITLSNSKLITYGEKQVFGSADLKTYNVTFLDDKSVITSALAADGAFSPYAKPVYSGNYGVVFAGTQITGNTCLYNYATAPAYTVTWLGDDGTVLETDHNVVSGSIPEYNGQVPTKPADSTNAYIFCGWTPEVAALSGDATYTAVFKPVSTDYCYTTLDLISDTALYRTQGRPYMTEEGLHLDFACAAVEFEAELGGTVAMRLSTEKELYFTLFVDGVAGPRIYVPEGDDQLITLAEYVEPGNHTLRLVRDSDVYRTGETMTITTIEFVGVKATVKPTAQRSLLIEFIGDSITSGKYTEMQYIEGEGIHRGINSYAYQAAQLLDADYSLVSRGGCGFFRVETCPIPGHKMYPYYNGFVAEPVEYATDRQADVVVLALGTNDSSSAVKTSYENGIVPFKTFIEAPQYVIGQIRAIHGEDVKIILLHNMMRSSWENELRQVADLEGVYFLKVTQNCDAGREHPSTEGHAVIAQELVTFLEQTVLADVRVCDAQTEQQVRYTSLQSAIDALQDGQYIRLQSNVNESVVLAGDVYLDLNGCTVNGDVSGEGTLYLMDSATDGYEAAGAGCITGNVTCTLAAQVNTRITGAARRYMVMKDENGYAAHRFYIGITHLNLKPGVTGVGYKAQFWGSEAVLAQIAETGAFGYTLQLEGMPYPVTAAVDKTALTSGKVITLRVDNFDVAKYGTTALTASVFLKLADGTVIESASVSRSMKDVVEALNANIAQLDSEQITAIQTMIQANAAAMADWAIDRLRTWSAADQAA